MLQKRKQRGYDGGDNVEIRNTILTVITTTLTSSLITGIISYLMGKLKGYKARDVKQEEALSRQEAALLCLLRSNITSKYYVYKELGEIPLYEKENIDYMAEQYKSMGGNSYVGGLVKEINKLPIKK